MFKYLLICCICHVYLIVNKVDHSGISNYIYQRKQHTKFEPTTLLLLSYIRAIRDRRVDAHAARRRTLLTSSYGTESNKVQTKH